MVRKESLKLILTAAAVTLAVGSVLFQGSLPSALAKPTKRAEVRKRPRSVQERFQEEFSQAAVGDSLKEESLGERDLFNQWFFAQRAYPSDSIPVGALGSAFNRSREDNDDSSDSDDPAEGHWRALGPSTIPKGQTDGSLGAQSPVSGRVSAIAAHPTNPDIVYVGGAQGGVWKTTNATSPNPHWRPLTDHEASLAVGSIAIDPVDPQIVYVGTGEPNRSCDSYYGQGILRSTDGGENWKLLGGGGAVFNNPGPFVGRAVARIIIDPKTAGSRRHTTLWASTTIGVQSGGTIPTCSIANPAAPFGLWRSTDSGATWQLQNVPVPGAGAFSVQDMVLDPVDHETLYAAVRSSRVGVWKSTNAATGAPATFTAMGVGFPTSANIRRINVAIGGPGAPGTLYAAVENTSGSRLLGLFKTTDGAATWSTVASVPAYCSGQCFYDMTVAVDPRDPTGNRVFIGGNPHAFAADLSGVPGGHTNWRSDDGGLHWRAISQGNGTSDSVHTDDHAYAFGADGSVYDGNDGGIWRSPDLGASWTSMNTDLAITQFQGVSTDPERKAVLGGTQDNGTNIRNRDLLKPPKWFHADFGDGGQSIIDQSNPQTMYHTYFNQAFNFMGPARSDIGGSGGPGSWPFVGAYYGYGSAYYNGMNPTDPVSFYAPLAQNVAFTPNVIYFGSDRVYRSPNPLPTLAQTPSWTAVSPRLTKFVGNYVSWITAFPQLLGGKEVLYAGSSDGALSASASVDGSGIAAWNRIDALPLPNRAVSGIATDTTDATANTAIVTFSGFEASTPTTLGHVFITTNGLSATPTWTNISGNLPDVPINAVVIDYVGHDDPRRVLYVASDIGVFRSRDSGETWKLVSKGLPFVSVFGLERNATSGQIVASTHGRGMFELSKEED
ncbi:MAG TPA: hypothetical protein VN461_07555 [Vicinamibacteria bacterium]|nr:hypothetical protein [Vicinamibacteria bacterium]